jgi:predicted kinase
MAGLSGTGKSTLALALGRSLGWPVLDKDSIKAPLLELGADEELAGAASYVVLYELARDLVRQGFSVILDTPASQPRLMQAAEELAVESGGKLRVILCTTDIPTRQQRMASRLRRVSQPLGPGLKAGDGRVTYDHLPRDTLFVNTAVPVEELISAVRKYVCG